MKKLISLSFILLFFAAAVTAQIDINNAINSVTGGGSGSGLSNEKIVSGLKEALNISTKTAATNASKLDGFYKNQLIKIMMPPEAREMEKTLKSLGMSKQVDDFVKSLNRAAEDASKKAAPIFVDAVTKMNINDGLSILNGGDNGATKYLQKSTSTQLTQQFQPIIKQSLSKVQVTKYWNQIAKSYNKVPFVKHVNPNLENYVTTKAIDGLFKLVAQEEAKIRKDPAKQVTDLLQQVFGNH